MSAWLLQLLGFDSAASRAQVRGWSLEFAGMIGPFMAALLIVGLGVAAWMLYRRNRTLSPARRTVLTTLRCLAMALLVLIAMQPTLVLTLGGLVKPVLVVLIDQSLSMNVADMNGQKRIDVLNRELLSDEGGLLAELGKTHEVRLMTFGQTTRLEPTGFVASGAAQPQTRLADALELAGKSAGAGGAVLVATDGRQTQDQNALSVAGRLASGPVTVFTRGLGSLTPQDVGVVSVTVPQLGFVNEKVTAVVRVNVRAQNATGSAGQGLVVRLKRGDTQVATATVNAQKPGVIDVPMEFTAQAAGDAPLVAEVDGVPGDVAPQNNQLSKPWQVVDRKMRVLLVEGSPRFEYRFLSEILLRDRRVDLKLFLTSASPELSQAADSPFVSTFPADAAELGRYDLIVLGDVAADAMTLRQQQNLCDWVTKLGGALVVMPRRETPQLWRRTVIESVLPVTLDAAPNPDSPQDGVEVELTPTGQESPMMRLSADDTINATKWRELPPLDWVARVSGVKPAADILVKRKGTNEPVMVMQQVGAGQVMWVGTDSLWRWRRNRGDEIHAAIWGQIVQRLAMPRVLAGGKLSRLTPDRHAMQTGQSVVVTATMFTPAFEPVLSPSQGLTVREPSGASRTVELTAVPGRPGQYRGTLKLESIGGYDLSLAGSDALPRRVWAVDDPDELRDVALNENLLRQIASTTGGEYLGDAEALAALPRRLEGDSARSTTQHRVPLWASWLVFATTIVLFSIEWLLRRSWQLK